jgi:hypothetical protein
MGCRHERLNYSKYLLCAEPTSYRIVSTFSIPRSISSFHARYHSDRPSFVIPTTCPPTLLSSPPSECLIHPSLHDCSSRLRHFYVVSFMNPTAPTPSFSVFDSSPPPLLLHDHSLRLLPSSCPSLPASELIAAAFHSITNVLFYTYSGLIISTLPLEQTNSYIPILVALS